MVPSTSPQPLPDSDAVSDVEIDEDMEKGRLGSAARRLAGAAAYGRLAWSVDSAGAKSVLT
jgi:hypothetical protein